MLSADERAAEWSLRNLLRLAREHGLLTVETAESLTLNVDTLVSGIERRIVALAETEGR